MWHHAGLMVWLNGHFVGASKDSRLPAGGSPHPPSHLAHPMPPTLPSNGSRTPFSHTPAPHNPIWHPCHLCHPCPQRLHAPHAPQSHFASSRLQLHVLWMPFSDHHPCVHLPPAPLFTEFEVTHLVHPAAGGQPNVLAAQVRADEEHG